MAPLAAGSRCQRRALAHAWGALRISAQLQTYLSQTDDYMDINQVSNADSPAADKNEMAVVSVSLESPDSDACCRQAAEFFVESFWSQGTTLGDIQLDAAQRATLLSAQQRDMGKESAMLAAPPRAPTCPPESMRCAARAIRAGCTGRDGLVRVNEGRACQRSGTGA